LNETHDADEADLAYGAAWAIGCIDLSVLMKLRDRYDVLEALTRFSSERDYLIYENYYVTPDGETIDLNQNTNLFGVMSVRNASPLYETFLTHLYSWGFSQTVVNAGACIGGIIFAPAPVGVADLDSGLLATLSTRAAADRNWPVLLITTDLQHAHLLESRLSFNVITAIVPECAATTRDFESIRLVIERWREPNIQ
jgi:hypothetical protein